jgi:polyisoprenoid-binding protein YceI
MQVKTPWSNRPEHARDMKLNRIGIPGTPALGGIAAAGRLTKVPRVAPVCPRLLAGLALLTVFYAGSAAPAESFSIDAGHTIPAFEVSHFGMTTQRGRFNRASGEAVLDFAARTGRISLMIDMRSIDIGSENANRLLKSPLMLDVDRFPTMRFVSERVEFAGDTVVAAEGALTLAGVTRPLRIAVTGFSCRLHPLVKRRLCGADVSASLRRSDFGLTSFLPDIGDLVRIDMPIESLTDSANGDAERVNGGTSGDPAQPRREGHEANSSGSLVHY